jgi:HEAT repeat protein
MCNELAKTIAEYGGEEAKWALKEALEAKRHHIRTAAIESLATFDDPAIVEWLKPLLDDAAYETRITAKSALEKLTGEKTVTARGEE